VANSERKEWAIDSIRCAVEAVKYKKIGFLKEILMRVEFVL
jgi:hypothetical protein